jgi:hypothetical protein
MLPGYFPLPVAEKVGDKLAPTAELLKVDFFGRPRDPKVPVPGPLLGLPLDGTSVKVDPRGPNRPRP